MPLQALLRPFSWASYSKKVRLRLDTPYCAGTFSAEEAQERKLHRAVGAQGELRDGNRIVFSWLVDREDGVIVDARFQAFGNTALIAAGEIACELAVGKNYDQARRISAELLEKHVHDKGDRPAFPEEASGHLNMVIDAIDTAAVQCEGIPLAESYVAPPIMGHEIEVVEGGYPGWDALTLKQQLAVVESVLDKEVRPFIELDAGGVQVLNIVKGREIVIVYEGACVGCYSSTGATLSYIQQMLRAKVHPEITVRPE